MKWIRNQILERENNRSILWDVCYTPSLEKKGIGIFVHGYKGFKDWGCWNLVAEAFAAEGYVFVKFNFSHNGGTIQEPIDFPDLEAFAENNYTKELDDLGDVIDFLCSGEFPLQNEIDLNSITLIGHSRGGGISILKASEDLRITRLITWASVSDFGSRFGTPEQIAKWRKDGVKYVLNGRTKQQMPHYYQFYEDYLANSERLSIKSAAEVLTIPMLIVHATADDAVKYSEAEALKSWYPGSELFTVSGSNHVFGGQHPWQKTNLPDVLIKVVQQSIAFLKQ